MRPVIYQLFVRHFSNMATEGVPWGSRKQNGCGTFNGVSAEALRRLADMGVTHVWLTGVLRHATQTAYPKLEAQAPSIVKGKAGSPYAVVDYFDVDPDLADSPLHRMQEFLELVTRCRMAGLVPLIDFIPNHVSRAYHSLARPELDFGLHDDTSSFFTRDNAFYYIPFGVGEGTPPFRLPSGKWEKETFSARVTGNNAITWQPSEFDWYETVKLNYGYDFRHSPPLPEWFPAKNDPPHKVPLTWRIMDEIIRFWQNCGVGGFRCDMAHMVPMPFWSWLNARAKVRDPYAFMLAEAYDDPMKTTLGDPLPALIESGFNAVYDSNAYHLAKDLYEAGRWANDFDKLNTPSNPCLAQGVRFIENHDEPRVCSPLHWGAVGKTVMPAVMTLLYCSGKGPVLVYNGQEVGEEAKGPAGFGGDNGRTSIFDYTCLPKFQKWVDSGRFSEEKLSPDEKELRHCHLALLRALSLPSIAEGDFYGLNWSNMETPEYGREAGENISGHWVYAFLKHDWKSGETALVVCNLSPESSKASTTTISVSIPSNAWDWCGISDESLLFTDVLNSSSRPLECSKNLAQTAGVKITLPPGKASIFIVTKAPSSGDHAKVEAK